MHLKQTHAKKHAHTQTHTEMHTCTHTETHTIWADISLSNVPFVLCPSLIFHREISGVSILHENVEVWRRPFNSLPFYFLRKCNYQNYWSSAGLAHLTCEIENIVFRLSLSLSLSLSLILSLSVVSHLLLGRFWEHRRATLLWSRLPSMQNQHIVHPQDTSMSVTHSSVLLIIIASVY